MPKYTKKEIYSILFQKIANGGYKDGKRLKEKEIAEYFNVSRTPIRVVLQQLAQDGLIQIHPNRGAIVRSLTPDDIEEIYEIRKNLEILALEYAVNIINLGELNKIQNKIINLQKKPDVAGAIKCDDELHLFIYQSSGKFRIINILNQLMRITERFRDMGFRDKAILDRVNIEHLELIDALVERDFHKGKTILAQHLDNSKIATLRFIFTNN